MSGASEGAGGQGTDPRPGDPVAHVLVVCRANVARSPLARALLEAEVHRRFGSDEQVWVRSAGTDAWAGMPAAEHTRREAERRSLDLMAHRAASLSPEDVALADVVVTMSEQQRAHVVGMCPVARDRVFTLLELARLCAVTTTGSGRSKEPVRARLRSVVARAARTRQHLPPPREAEDVADPYGGPRAGFAHMAALIEAAVSVVADCLLGSAEGTQGDVTG